MPPSILLDVKLYSSSIAIIILTKHTHTHTGAYACTHTNTQLDSEIGGGDEVCSNGVPQKVMKQDGMSMSGPCLCP